MVDIDRTKQDVQISLWYIPKNGNKPELDFLGEYSLSTEFSCANLAFQFYFKDGTNTTRELRRGGVA